MNKHELQDLGGGTVSGLLASRAAWAPDNLALMFEEQRYTYRDLDGHASRTAAGLMGLALARSDATAIFMTNRPEHLFATYGISRAGLVQVSVNTAYKGSFLQFALQHAEAKVLITEARLAEALLTLAELPPALHTIVFADGVPPELGATSLGRLRLLSWEQMLEAGSATPEFPHIEAHDTCAISFTSGTTGGSKGVVSPHLQSVIMGREAAAAFGLTPRDRVYTCMPLFHGMAQVTTGVAALYAGATIVLSRRFSVTAFWDEIRACGATQASALGSMLHMLLSAPPSQQDQAHQLTRIFAAPAPADVLYRFERRYNVHIIEGYGSTEIKNVLYNPLEGRRIGSIGLPTPSSIIEIHDDNGERLLPGEVGEIVYRPRMPNIMLKRYHREAEKTLENMHGLWWHTGDLGSQDSDGFFYFFDRKSDALRRRGENISSPEVEAVLTTFPGVRDAAAIGVAADVGESELLVVLEVAEPGQFDLAGLFHHCVQHMPRFMVPRYYRLVQALPRTPTGKVQKILLRQAGVDAETWDHLAHGLSAPR